MEYITFRRFKGKAICGDVNLSALTPVFLKGEILYFDNEPVCLLKSENAHQYFARNDDGNGMERGHLTQNIIKVLSQNDDKHQTRWDKVWNDAICKRYKRKEYLDYWLWNNDFYNADIADLEHIYQLIKGE